MEEKGQALYRRYRSMSFDELIGQEHATKLLKASVEKGNFSHAYLFTGQRGTGKTSAARIMAYAINGLPYAADSKHLDIIEIDAASNRRIDDIRDLREKVHIAPVSAKYKVYIIDEVHMLTGESFNALLKTIEEPPEHAVFILATTELHKVPATIISRTQRFHFRPVAPARVAEHLSEIAKKEKIDIDTEALLLIAEHGGGSFRDSISLLDQLGSLEGKITTETVEAILGRVRSSDVASIIQLVESYDQSSLHAALKDLTAQGASPVTLSEQIVASLLASPKNNSRWYELTEKLMSVPKAHFPGLLLTSTLLGFATNNDNGEVKNNQAPKPKLQKEVEAPDAPVEDSADSDTQAAERTADTDKQSTITEADESQTLESQPTNSNTTNSDMNSPDGEETPVSSSEFDWNKVTEAVKKANPALYGVLSRAEASLKGDTLNLIFQYALHRKKMEQSQYKTQLAKVIKDTCGLSPVIVVADGKSLPVDETVKKVAELMGGGESVVL